MARHSHYPMKPTENKTKKKNTNSHGKATHTTKQTKQENERALEVTNPNQMNYGLR
jgi:hypothetical protein